MMDARSENMAKFSVLVVDDDEDALHGLGLSLRSAGYNVGFATSGESALGLLLTTPFDIIISDHQMPGMTGMEFLTLVHDRHPDTIRIILTGHADTKLAIKAINHGEIYRFLVKPCDRSELLVTLHLARERLELERENRRLLTIIRSHPELAAQLDKADSTRKRPGPGLPESI